jgi:hypothetical protein
MIQIPVPVKYHRLDVFFQKPLSHHFSQLPGPFHRHLDIPEVLLQRRCGGQSMPFGIVNDLNKQRPVAPDNGHPGPLGGPGNTLADMDFPLEPFSVFFKHFSQHFPPTPL